MDHKFHINRYFPYILPAALYTLWQTSAGWLNTWWTQQRLGDGFTTVNFVLFFAAHALGTAYVAWRLDRPVSARRLIGFALVSTLSTALFTALMAFADGLWLMLTGVLSGLAAGFFTAFLSFYIFLHIPSEHRGAVLGISSGAGLWLHYMLFTLLFPQTSDVFLYGKTFFCAAVFLLVGVFSLALPLCRDGLRRENSAFYTGPGESGGLRPRLMPFLVLLLLLFFISHGIQDFAATAYWLSGSGYLGHTRVFLIIGFVLGGFLWDGKRRSMLLSLGFGLLALGFIAMACRYEGAASFVGLAGVQLASVFVALSVRIVFLDIARFYERPAFTASLGLVLPMIFKQAGILFAGVAYGLFGGTALFVVSLVCIAVGFPVVALLFEKVRDMNVLDVRANTPVAFFGGAPAGQPEPPQVSGPAREAEKGTKGMAGVAFDLALLTLLSQKYRFTKREIQIIELSLHGLTNWQMAQRMSISEATVKYHIRNILGKTDTKNLKQLFLTAAKEKKWTECTEA